MYDIEIVIYCIYECVLVRTYVTERHKYYKSLRLISPFDMLPPPLDGLCMREMGIAMCTNSRCMPSYRVRNDIYRIEEVCKPKKQLSL